MEARNITIVSTKNQNKYVIYSAATTLAELKNDLSANNIDYEDMTFYEGLSHTELLTDEAILPHDVPYKGVITNELVFMLTTPNKKIKSGSYLPETRQALYDTIAELNLQDTCRQTYGKNFTQCKNSELMSLIEDAQAALVESDPVEEALRVLVDILEEDEVLYKEDADKVRSILDNDGSQKENKSPYSEEELDGMFNFLN